MMYLTRADASLASTPWHISKKKRSRSFAAPRRAGKAPIDPCANIFRSPKDTLPLGRQYFRVWLGHQFVIKSTPLPAVPGETVAGPRVIILNRAAPGPSISSFH